MEEKKVLQEEGENIIPITHETCVIDDDGNTVIDKIGDVSLLNTNSKNLVGAINEVFSDTIKQQIIDVLINSGIEVNKDESWVNIIDKLKNNSGGGEIFPGISCVPSLPTEVEDGNIIIISESYNNIYVDNKKINEMNLTEGDIYIKYGLESPYTENLTDSESFVSIHLEVVYQMINNEIVFVNDIYKGVNGEWVKILDSRVYYFNEGVFSASSSNFTINLMSQYNISILTSGDYINYFKLDVQNSNGTGGILSYGTDNKIDLTQFSKIKLTYVQKNTASSSNSSYYTPGAFGMFTAKERQVYNTTDSRITCSKFVEQSLSNVDKESIIEMDVTNINGEHYFAFAIATPSTYARYTGMYVKSIEFIKQS